MKKLNVTKINYECGCVGEIFQKHELGKWYSDKKIICPHN